MENKPQFPILTVYCEQLDRFFNLPLINNRTGYYEGPVDIPVNTTGEDIHYTFELYANGHATGRMIESICDSGNHFYEVVGFYSDKTFTLSPGGDVKFMATVDKEFINIDYSLADYDAYIPPELYLNSIASFVSKQGDVFFYTLTFNESLPNTGLWYYNRRTKEIEKVYDEGSLYNFWFETAEGLIFATSNNTIYARDIVMWDRETETFIPVFQPTVGGFIHWYETNDGKIFVSSNNINSVGILQWNNETVKFESVYTAGYYWNHWIEDSNGNLFVSTAHSATNYGLLHYDDTVEPHPMFVRKISAGDQYRSWIEANNRVYVSCHHNTSPGLFAWNPETRMLDTVCATGYRYDTMHITENGEPGGTLLIGSNGTYGTGILMIPIVEDPEDPTAMVVTAYTPQANTRQHSLKFTEDEYGNVVITDSNTTGNAGILLFTKSTQNISKGYTLGNGWCYVYKDKRGIIFIHSNSTAANCTGIVRYLPETRNFTLKYTTGSVYNYITEFKDGVFFRSNNEAGVFRYDYTNDNITKHYSIAYWEYSFQTDVNLYFGSNNTNGILWWNPLAKNFTYINEYPVTNKRWFYNNNNQIALENGAVIAYQYEGNAVLLDQATCKSLNVGLLNSSYPTIKFIKASDGTVFTSSVNEINIPGLYRVDVTDPVLTQVIPYGSNYDVIFHSEYGDFIGSSDTSNPPRHTGIYKYKDGEIKQVYPHGHFWEYFGILDDGTIAAWSKYPQGLLIYNIADDKFEKSDEYYGQYINGSDKIKVYKSHEIQGFVSCDKMSIPLELHYNGDLYHSDKAICVFNNSRTRAAVVIPGELGVEQTIR